MCHPYHAVRTTDVQDKEDKSRQICCKKSLGITVKKNHLAKNLGKSKQLNLLAFSGHKRHLCLDEMDERECTQWVAKDRHG
jgi:hypothetical protein